jgi:polyketide cyclase/dehydrase/lipid transport protein
MGTQDKLPHHTESRGLVAAAADRVFAHLDDHTRLAAHMTKRSWMMVGSRMALQLDAAGGRAIGSHIRLAGRVLGVRLEVDEVVIERDVPSRKVWATVDTPRLVVVGPYRMGFSIEPAADGRVSLTVFLDYGPPTQRLSRLIGWRLGHAYARWCTRRMVEDAQAAFGR